MKKNIRMLAGFLILFASAGCSTVNNFLDSKVSVDYSKSSSVKALEIPPDLTSPQFDNSFDVPSGGTVSAAAMQNGVATSGMVTSSAAQPVPAVVNPRVGNLASVRSLNGQAVLQIHDTHKRALIMTDIILERMGFAILSRDAPNGIYRVEYNGKDINSNEKEGFLSRLFKSSGKDDKILTKGKVLQVRVSQENGNSYLRVNDASGKPFKASQNTSILALLNNEFNR